MDTLCLYNLIQTLKRAWSNLKVVMYVNLCLRLGFTWTFKFDSRVYSFSCLHQWARYTGGHFLFLKYACPVCTNKKISFLQFTLQFGRKGRQNLGAININAYALSYVCTCASLANDVPKGTRARVRDANKGMWSTWWHTLRTYFYVKFLFNFLHHSEARPFLNKVYRLIDAYYHRCMVRWFRGWVAQFISYTSIGWFVKWLVSWLAGKLVSILIGSRTDRSIN